MTIKELIAAMKEYEGTPEFNDYIASQINTDRVNKFIESDDGRKYIQPKYDAYFDKSIETWKNNNLNTFVDAEVKKRFPEADPKDTELAAVKAELEKMKAESLRKDLTNKALTIATEKGLPVDLINYFIGTDEEATKANLDKLEKIYTDGISAAVEKKLKGSNYIPPEGDNKEPLDGVSAAFAKLNPNINLAE